MSSDRAKRLDRIVAILALVLLIDLLKLPWYTVGGGTVSGIALPSISNPATGSPAAIFGVFAVLATLAILLDLIFQAVSPGSRIPAVAGNRSLTRFLLASFAAALLALKFILNVTEIGNLGVGFWLAVPLTAGLVYMTMRARRDEAPRAGADAAEDGDEDAEASSHEEQPRSADGDGDGDPGRGRDGEDDRDGDRARDNAVGARESDSGKS